MANNWIPFNPTHMRWDDWQGYMIEDWAELSLPLMKEDNWKEFARAFTSRQGLADFALPNPDNFMDWKEWARSLQTAVNR